MESLPNNRLYVLPLQPFQEYYQCELERIMLDIGCDITTPTNFREDFQRVIDVIDKTLPEYLFWEWIDQTNDESSVNLYRQGLLAELMGRLVKTIVYLIPNIYKIERYGIPGILLDFDEEFIYVLDIRSDVHVPYPLYSKARRRLYT